MSRQRQLVLRRLRQQPLCHLQLIPEVVNQLRKATGTFRDALVSRSLDLARRWPANQPDQLAEWRSIARFLRGASVIEVTKETGTDVPPGAAPPTTETIGKAA